MGHGVASALVMSAVRAVLRDRVETAGSLADLMGRLNRLIAADHQGERYLSPAKHLTAEVQERGVRAG